MMKNLIIKEGAVSTHIPSYSLWVGEAQTIYTIICLYKEVTWAVKRAVIPSGEQTESMPRNWKTAQQRRPGALEWLSEKYMINLLMWQVPKCTGTKSLGGR